MLGTNCLPPSFTISLIPPPLKNTFCIDINGGSAAGSSGLQNWNGYIYGHPGSSDGSNEGL